MGSESRFPFAQLSLDQILRLNSLETYPKRKEREQSCLTHKFTAQPSMTLHVRYVHVDVDAETARVVAVAPAPDTPFA